MVLSWVEDVQSPDGAGEPAPEDAESAPESGCMGGEAALPSLDQEENIPNSCEAPRGSDCEEKTGLFVGNEEL